MPRILHVVYSLIRGGSEGQCARVVLGLAGRGYQQRVAVSVREGYFLDPVECACGPVHLLGIDRMASLKTLQRLRIFARLLREERIDLVHAWDADAVIFGGIAAAWAGIPFISSQRDMGEIYSAWKWRLMLRAHRNAAKVAVNAEAIRNLLEGLGVARASIEVIPNAVDLREFDRQSGLPFEHRDLLPPRPRIAAVARLDPEKDTLTLLRAVHALKEKGLHASAVIAGDGVEREALVRQCKALGISERACFLGDTPDIPSLLREVDIGVLTPQRNEGLSNTLLEYMAAGLPVVATDCGGNRELIVSGVNGWVVPRGSVDGVACALQSLLENPAQAKAMGQAGRRRVEASFDRDIALDRLDTIYQMAAARAPA